MSINRALPSLRADVAAIYAAQDHAALRALYERLIGEWSEDELSDLQHPESLRDHLLDYVRELCSASGTHVLDAGIRPEVLPLYLQWHEHYPAMQEADFLRENGWWDVSDRNDACPCFESIDRTQRLWVQHPVAEVREPAGAPLFSLFSIDDEGNSTPIYSGNEWTEFVHRLVLPDTAPAIPVGEVVEVPATPPGIHEAVQMLGELDAYLRAIRAEELDGSEPALGELLDRSLALRLRHNA